MLSRVSLLVLATDSTSLQRTIEGRRRPVLCSLRCSSWYPIVGNGKTLGGDGRMVRKVRIYIHGCIAPLRGFLGRGVRRGGGTSGRVFDQRSVGATEREVGWMVLFVGHSWTSWAERRRYGKQGMWASHEQRTCG